MLKSVDVKCNLFPPIGPRPPTECKLGKVYLHVKVGAGGRVKWSRHGITLEELCSVFLDDSHVYMSLLSTCSRGTRKKSVKRALIYSARLMLTDKISHFRYIKPLCTYLMP